MPVLFISGIDTGVGKTVVTGLLAKEMKSMGLSVITQKLVQTGNTGISEDIQTHRKLMELELTVYDLDGTTCPYVFSYPGSPALAARLEKKTVDTDIITAATAKLQQKYGWVLLEGAGGLMVPLNEKETILDYVAARQYQVLLVTTPKLGSINQTLLSYEILRQRRIKIAGLTYNCFFSEKPEIVSNTLEELKQRCPNLPIVELHDGRGSFKELISQLKK